MGDREYRCPICGIERNEHRVIQHLQISHRKSTLCQLLLQQRNGVDGDPGPLDGEPQTRSVAPEATDEDSEETEPEELTDDATPKPA